jgi:nicotinate-nucleotide adenylyltransferase
MNKIGIFGGTFDPIHYGHINILNCFIEKCNLDICYIIPAKCSPFKQNKTNMYSDDERIKLIEKEIINIPKIKISRYEIDNTEISYTINTITYFKNQFTDVELFLLIGYYVATQFHL